MAKRISKITDAVINKVGDAKWESYLLTLDEMVDMVDKYFISEASTKEEYDQILKTVKGGLLLPKDLKTKDENCTMHVATHQSVGIFNMKDHNYIWIQDKNEEKHYEYKAYFWGKFKKAVKERIDQKSK